MYKIFPRKVISIENNAILQNDEFYIRKTNKIKQTKKTIKMYY